MRPSCYLWHLTLGGHHPWWDEGWTIQLLSAAYQQAEAQRTQGPLAWEMWLPIDEGFSAHHLQGGLS